MKQHSEKDFIFPALLVIFNEETDCSMEKIKDEIGKYIDLTKKDMTPYPSRSQDEPRYRQICGNLVSHRTAGFYEYVEYIVPEEELGKKNPRFLFSLNDEGREYVINKLQEIKSDSLLEYCIDEKVIERDKYDEKIIKYANEVLKNKIYKTDNKIRNQVIELSGHKCMYGEIIGEKHKVFYGKDNKPYVEGHHLIPMHAQSDFAPKSLDRPENIVPLCPICHARIHRGNEDERKEMVQILYNHYINQLNNSDIYISKENLFENYYK